MNRDEVLVLDRDATTATCEYPHDETHHDIGMGCGKNCPTCGDPCVVTFTHASGGHSCGDHSW